MEGLMSNSLIYKLSIKKLSTVEEEFELILCAALSNLLLVFLSNSQPFFYKYAPHSQPQAISSP
jgi:hypothetical protein